MILGCMSAAILLAEATILPSGVDLSLFSILINAVGKQEVLVQVNIVCFLVRINISFTCKISTNIECSDAWQSLND